MKSTFIREITNKSGTLSKVGEYFEDENVYYVIGTGKYKMRLFDKDKNGRKTWDGCWNVGRKEDFEKIFFKFNTTIKIIDADINTTYIIKSDTIRELQKDGYVYEYKSLLDEDKIHLFVPSNLCRKII